MITHYNKSDKYPTNKWGIRKMRARRIVIGAHDSSRLIIFKYMSNLEAIGLKELWQIVHQGHNIMIYVHNMIIVN